MMMKIRLLFVFTLVSSVVFPRTYLWSRSIIGPNSENVALVNKNSKTEEILSSLIKHNDQGLFNVSEKRVLFRKGPQSPHRITHGGSHFVSVKDVFLSTYLQFMCFAKGLRIQHSRGQFSSIEVADVKPGQMFACAIVYLFQMNRLKFLFNQPKCQS